MGLGFVLQARMGIATSVFQNTRSPLRSNFLCIASKFNLSFLQEQCLTLIW